MSATTEQYADMFTKAGAAIDMLTSMGYEYSSDDGGTWKSKPAEPAPTPAPVTQVHIHSPDAVARALDYLLLTLLNNSSGEAHGKIKIALEILEGKS